MFRKGDFKLVYGFPGPTLAFSPPAEMCDLNVVPIADHVKLCNTTETQTGENFNPAPIFAAWWEEYTQAEKDGIFERVLLYNIRGDLALAL